MPKTSISFPGRMTFSIAGALAECILAGFVLNSCSPRNPRLSAAFNTAMSLSEKDTSWLYIVQNVCNYCCAQSITLPALFASPAEVNIENDFLYLPGEEKSALVSLASPEEAPSQPHLFAVQKGLDDRHPGLSLYPVFSPSPTYGSRQSSLRLSVQHCHFFKIKCLVISRPFHR